MSLALPENQWMSDENVSACMACNCIFNILNRRHHCRRCGGIFCSSCSSRRLRLDKRSKEAQRVCDACFKQLTSLPANAPLNNDATPAMPSSRRSVQQQSTVHKQMSNSPVMPSMVPDSSSLSSGKNMDSPSSIRSERILYQTLSLCARCSFIDKKGFDWQPAVMMEKDKKIYLRVLCNSHPHDQHSDTLVMSNSSFFLRLASFDPILFARITNSSPRVVEQIPDIEELHRSLKTHTSFSSLSPASIPRLLPLFFDVSLWQSNHFVDDNEVFEKIRNFRASIPENSRFVLKVQGGLPEKHQIEDLNRKLHAILQLTKSSASSSSLSSSSNPSSSSSSSPPTPPRLLHGCPILVDLPYERLLDLLALPDSIFLKSRVFPELRYYLAAGEEAATAAEIQRVVDSVKSITDLHFVLSIHIESAAPLPNLERLIQQLQKNTGIIRFVMFVVERSPRLVINRLLSSDGEKSDERSDAFALIQELERASVGKIRHSDFFPARYAMLLAPFLAYFGGGEFHLNASPLCAFGAAMTNSPSLNFVSLSRLFDIPKLYEKMAPIANRMRNGEERFGLMTVKALQKVLKESALSSNYVPTLSDYLSLDGPAADSMQTFVKNLQFITVHNKMDFASLDGHRRIGCAQIMSSPVIDGQFVASCSGCV